MCGKSGGDGVSGETERIAATLREELARRRMSRQALADAARVSMSTLEKALTGSRPFTLATLIRLEEALGVKLRDAAPTGPQIAPAELGGYARPSVRWLEGRYLVLRPHMRESGAISAYALSIDWREAEGWLGFREERGESDIAQEGRVSVPWQSGHVHLVTNVQGQVRLMTLCRPTPQGEMHGILATLLMGQGAHLLPAAIPLALVAWDRARGRLRALLAGGIGLSPRRASAPSGGVAVSASPPPEAPP
jgi:transcriptional regulator with XRE-family HTH domain